MAFEGEFKIRGFDLRTGCGRANVEVKVVVGHLWHFRFRHCRELVGGNKRDESVSL
jgi:hypothetical protein